MFALAKEATPVNASALYLHRTLRSALVKAAFSSGAIKFPNAVNLVVCYANEFNAF